MKKRRSRVDRCPTARLRHFFPSFCPSSFCPIAGVLFWKTKTTAECWWQNDHAEGEGGMRGWNRRYTPMNADQCGNDSYRRPSAFICGYVSTEVGAGFRKFKERRFAKKACPPELSFERARRRLTVRAVGFRPFRRSPMRNQWPQPQETAGAQQAGAGAQHVATGAQQGAGAQTGTWMVFSTILQTCTSTSFDTVTGTQTL